MFRSKKIPERKWFSLYLIPFIGILSFFIGAYIYHSNNIASSPQKAWQLLLFAMENDDLEQLQNLTTSRGFHDLMTVRNESENTSRWPNIVNRLVESEVRWYTEDESTVIAFIGDPIRESGFVFTRGSNGWKLDRLMRGE